MKKSPAEVFTTVINEVDYLIKSLGEQTDDKEVLKQQNYAKEKLAGVHNELQESLNHLAKNAEWDVFTIAFYGETNAGKSTLIETLRILLSEPYKKEERKMFDNVYQTIGRSEESIGLVKNDFNQVYASFEKKVEQLREKIETEVSHQTELTGKAELEKCKVDDLQTLIIKKRRSNLWNFIKGLFNLLDEQKVIIDAHETINQFEIELTITNQEIDKTQHKIEQTNAELQEKNEVFYSEISILEENLANQNNEIMKYIDGKIVGDGSSDYTQEVSQYKFKYKNQNFAILDLPGIEGREEIVIDEINNAVERAHAVFYVSGKAAPPQNGDEESEGTVDKIKRHLSQHTEVYFIYNKRVKNPKQFRKPLIGEDEKSALKEVDDVLNKVLSEQYEGHKVLSAYPALLSVGNFWEDRVCKNQRKFLDQLGSAEDILADSGVKDFSNWLRTSLVEESKSKIIKSNYRKISVAIEHTQENISEIQREFTSLKKKLRLNEKYTNRKLDEESELFVQNLENEAITIIRKFKNSFRKKMYDEIDKEIDNDEFKIIFEKEKEFAIEEVRQQMRIGMRDILKEFEKEIKEIVMKNERYTTELLQSFDDSIQFDFEFEPILNIKNSGSVAGTVLSLVSGVGGVFLSFTNPIGWAVIVLSVVGMLISVGKNVLGFFNHGYRASQQRNATNENIEEMATELSTCIRENINKTHDPLMREIDKVKGDLSFAIKYINEMNRVFKEAERKLKSLSWEIEQEGMGKLNGNN